MKKIQHIVSTHKSLFILGGVLLVGLWFCFFEQSMFATGKHTAPANPGIVAVQSNASSAVLPALSKSRRALIPMHTQQEEVIAYTTSYHDMPKAKMTSTSARLHETSGATTKVIGGGGNAGNGLYSTSSNRQSNNGVNSGNLSYGGNMLTLSTSLALAAPGASTANDISQLASAPESRHKIVTPPKPSDPVPNPVGDVPFAVMALLTIAWCVRVRLRRRSACSTDK